MDINGMDFHHELIAIWMHVFYHSWPMQMLYTDCYLKLAYFQLLLQKKYINK